MNDKINDINTLLVPRAALAAPAQDDALTAAYMSGLYDAKKAARAAAQPVAVVASKLGDICSFRSSVARKGDVVYFQPPAQAQDARKPLTDDQIDEIHLANSDAYERGDVEYESHGFARAIEAHYNITGKAEGAQP